MTDLSPHVMPLTRRVAVKADVDRKGWGDPDVVHETENRLLEELRHHVKELGHALNDTCVRFEHEDPGVGAPPNIGGVVAAWWMPPPYALSEFVGGASDGQTASIREVPAGLPEPHTWMPSARGNRASRHELYRLYGFNNQTARWVYTLAEPLPRED